MTTFRLSSETRAGLDLAREMLSALRGGQSDKTNDDKYAQFYRSRAWRAARYKFMASQPKPLRCAACGATAKETRLACDHIAPIKTEAGWARRLDVTGLQMLCAGNDGCAGNLTKGRDTTDFR